MTSDLAVLFLDGKHPEHFVVTNHLAVSGGKHLAMTIHLVFLLQTHLVDVVDLHVLQVMNHFCLTQKEFLQNVYVYKLY